MFKYNHLKEDLTLNDHVYGFYNVENLDKLKYCE